METRSCPRLVHIFSLHSLEEKGFSRRVSPHLSLHCWPGEEAGIISRKTLHYGNYSVPLVIQDQQGAIGKDVLELTVCDCGETNSCLGRGPLSTVLGPAAIGLIILGLLLFLCEYENQSKKLMLHQPTTTLWMFLVSSQFEESNLPRDIKNVLCVRLAG